MKQMKGFIEVSLAYNKIDLSVSQYLSSQVWLQVPPVIFLVIIPALGRLR